jgi:hypothetical protein
MMTQEYLDEILENKYRNFSVEFEDGDLKSDVYYQILNAEIIDDKIIATYNVISYLEYEGEIFIHYKKNRTEELISSTIAITKEEFERKLSDLVNLIHD